MKYRAGGILIVLMLTAILLLLVSTTVVFTQEYTGYIYVESEPSGADVYLDGDYVGTTSIELPVYPGEHEIKCAKSGYNDYYDDMRVEAGETTYVWCELEPIPEEEGYIKVESEPSGADVYLDWEYVGTTPIELLVSPGEHEIKCAKSGYNDYYDDMRVEAGETKDVWCELEPEPIPEEEGYIKVESEPSGAEVYLDGDYTGTTPKKIDDVSTGYHTIVLKKSGYEDWSTSVYFTSGSAESIYASMTPSILVPIWLVAIVAALPLIFISYWRVRNLILNGYRKKMEKWKEEGYEVSKLKEVLELKKDLKLIKSKFTDFEEGIKTLKQLKEELLSLDSKGFESEADAIKEKLKDAEKIHAIIEEIQKLKVEIEKRKKIMEECRAKKEKWKKEGYDVSELEGVC